jgi:lysylphosphatidylglycerol synthetase-like protein (DUF2156 family)
MSNPHEVISAFLDDEPIEANELAQALSEPDGRALLIDLLALRHVMQPDKAALHFAEHRTPSRLRALVAVAAMVVALVGGYLLGQRRSELGQLEAPPATRVVEATTGWQVLP